MRCATWIAVFLLVNGFQSAAVAAVEWRQPDAEPGFKGLAQELQHLADQDGRARVNTFCAVVQSERRPKSAKNLDGGYTWLLVHWVQRHRLYTFGAADDRYGLTDTDIFHGMPLDLRKDVVTSEHDVGGSTYLVTRAWVADVERHCRDNGTSYTIIRSASGNTPQ